MREVCAGSKQEKSGQVDRETEAGPGRSYQ